MLYRVAIAELLTDPEKGTTKFMDRGHYDVIGTDLNDVVWNAQSQALEAPAYKGEIVGGRALLYAKGISLLTKANDVLTADEQPVSSAKPTDEVPESFNTNLSGE